MQDDEDRNNNDVVWEKTAVVCGDNLQSGQTGVYALHSLCTIYASNYAVNTNYAISLNHSNFAIMLSYYSSSPLDGTFMRKYQ